jgi:hypothetical protein
MSLDVETAIALIRKAFQKKNEDRAFQLYASVYPHFKKENFKKFEEFYKQPKQEVSTRSKEEILADAMEIMRKVGEKHGTVSPVRDDSGQQ